MKNVYWMSVAVIVMSNGQMHAMKALQEKQKLIAAKPARACQSQGDKKDIKNEDASGLFTLFCCEQQGPYAYSLALNLARSTLGGAYEIGCQLLEDTPLIVKKIKENIGAINTKYGTLQGQYQVGSSERKKIDDFYQALQNINNASSESDYPKLVYELYKSAGIGKLNLQGPGITYIPITPVEAFFENPANIALYQNVWSKKYELGNLYVEGKYESCREGISALQKAQNVLLEAKKNLKPAPEGTKTTKAWKIFTDDQIYQSLKTSFVEREHTKLRYWKEDNGKLVRQPDMNRWDEADFNKFKEDVAKLYSFIDAMNKEKNTNFDDEAFCIIKDAVKFYANIKIAIVRRTLRFNATLQDKFPLIEASK